MRKWIVVVALLTAGCVYHRPRVWGNAPDGPPLGRSELERLAAAGVSGAVIAELLDRRGATKLTADDVVAIKKAGASDETIQKAITSERPEPAVARAEEPVYYYHCCYPYYWWYPHWIWYPSIGFSYYRWSRRGRVAFGFGW